MDKREFPYSQSLKVTWGLSTPMTTFCAKVIDNNFMKLWVCSATISMC